MNKQQQELYEKLLKKVNEFCLGAAAEDVIECIDALVTTYEEPKVDPVSTPLEVFNKAKRIIAKYDHDTKDHLIEFDLKQSEWNIIETALKALEIIKNKEVHIVCLKKSHNLTHYHQLLKSNYCEKRKLTQEEYNLLKEILK